MDAQVINIAIVVVYLLAMLAFGWWGKSRTKNNSDFLVAGRRLGPFLYTGTMAAVVLGGASTVGGVGLGYKFGISGMWLVVAIGAGVLLLSLLFAAAIGLLRFPDLMSRMHAATKPQVLGLFLLLAAVGLQLRTWWVWPVLLVAWIFQLLTVPVSAHMVGRAGYRTKYLHKELLSTDELEAVVLKAAKAARKSEADDGGSRTD